MKNESFNNTHEYTILQTDLLEEKRKHLETVRELSTCQTKLKELEDLIDARLSEAIQELNEKQTLIEDLQKVCHVSKLVSYSDHSNSRTWRKQAMST